MRTYTYSEARQKLASVLKNAEATGKVIITRKDGMSFALIPERPNVSPLDVPTVEADIDSDGIVKIVRSMRKGRSAHRM